MFNFNPGDFSDIKITYPGDDTHKQENKTQSQDEKSGYYVSPDNISKERLKDKKVDRSMGNPPASACKQGHGYSPRHYYVTLMNMMFNTEKTPAEDERGGQDED